MRRFSVLAVFGVILLAGIMQMATAQSKGQTYKVAVLPFKTDIESNLALEPAISLFREFEKMSTVDPIPIQSVAEALRNRNLSTSECYDASCARSIGYALKANFVVHGEITSTFSGYEVNLVTTHVNSGKTFSVARKNVAGDLNTLLGQMPEIAMRLMKIRPANTTQARNGQQKPAQTQTIEKKGGNAKWALIGLALAGGVGAALVVSQGGGDNPDPGGETPTKTQLPMPPPLTGGD